MHYPDPATVYRRSFGECPGLRDRGGGRRQHGRYRGPLHAFSARPPEVVAVTNTGRHGFGMAIRYGLTHMTGDAVAIVMADGSDSPEDLLK